MDTTKITFPASGVEYDLSSTLPPDALPAGYFLHCFHLEDLIGVSSDPSAATKIKGKDHLILRAGTFLMMGTLETHWFVEVMDSDGETMTVVSAGPLCQTERIEVPMSAHSIID